MSEDTPTCPDGGGEATILLKELPSSVPGPDGILNLDFLSDPLNVAALMNAVLYVGRPLNNLESRLVSILKTNDLANPGEYQPIGRYNASQFTTCRRPFARSMGQQLTRQSFRL